MRLDPRFAAVSAGLVLAVVLCAAAAARSSSQDLRDVAVGDLPREAHEVLARIAAGGPFPFDRDGITFGNRERQLPSAPHGYYHEYTVPTPGAKTRGARRIICGGARKAPEICYYTSDHYRTFRRIRE
jgi:ribonuclease T1